MLRAFEQFEANTRLPDVADRERRKWFIAARRHHEEKEFRNERSDGAFEEFAAANIVADAMELEAFSAELDQYDEATVKAIAKNREVLDRLIAERDAMLAEAHVLADGTRVFRSEDGQRVYDENGRLVPSDVITPEEIPDYLPNAESYLRTLSGIKKHQAIEARLYEYQAKLDEARERVASGKMTRQELEDYRRDLQREMPIEVRRELPDYDAAKENSLKSNFISSTKPSTLTASDMAIDPSLVPG